MHIIAHFTRVSNLHHLEVHVILPLIYAIVLLGLIQNGVYNAATWSNISNQLQSTLWPFLLRADAAAASNVRWRVRLLSVVVVFGTICLAVAGFLTPKPLLEHRRRSHHIKSLSFQYVQGTMSLTLALICLLTVPAFRHFILRTRHPVEAYRPSPTPMWLE